MRGPCRASVSSLWSRGPNLVGASQGWLPEVHMFKARRSAAEGVLNLSGLVIMGTAVLIIIVGIAVLVWVAVRMGQMQRGAVNAAVGGGIGLLLGGLYVLGLGALIAGGAEVLARLRSIEAATRAIAAVPIPASASAPVSTPTPAPVPAAVLRDTIHPVRPNASSHARRWMVKASRAGRLETFTVEAASQDEAVRRVMSKGWIVNGVVRAP